MIIYIKKKKNYFIKSISNSKKINYLNIIKNIYISSSILENDNFIFSLFQINQLVFKLKK